MEMKICQSCSMPLEKEEDYGTTKTGEKSEDYCVYCFKDGDFTENMTLEEAIAQAADYADMAGMTKEQALEHAEEVYPTLKRWKE